MRVIAVANQKGGCGKTTTSIHFAACLAFLKKKTLLMDLDPQGHSTCGLGVDTQSLPANLYHLLSPQQQRPVPVKHFVSPLNPHFSMVPSSGALFGLEEELAHYPEREQRLKMELNRMKYEIPDLDFVILDCPPNLGVLTYNAFEGADEVLIPIEPSFFSLHGLAKMAETLNAINQRRNRPIEIHALLTIFDSRTCFAKEVYEEVKRHFQEKLFRTIIHENVLFKEAASAGQSIVDYAPDSPAFHDYLNLAVEYLERQWERMLPAKKLGWNHVFDQHFGPKKVTGGILFQCVSKNAKTVEIAGDFNHWIPEPLVRRDDQGLWQKVIAVSAGTFRYKFIVDGEWQIDPYQPVQQMNAFGTYDSYLEVV